LRRKTIQCGKALWYLWYHPYTCGSLGTRNNRVPYQPKWRQRNKFGGERAVNMERKDSDNHDNFFASLNQLILSLEPAIKEAGSVAAAEDILTHLEATDENFHRFVSKLTHSLS